MDKNLQRNNVAGQVEGFCISYFAAFRNAIQGNDVCVYQLPSLFFLETRRSEQRRVVKLALML